MSRKILASMTAGLRTARPWSCAEEYSLAQLGNKGTNYFMFLTWELSVDFVADKLRESIGPKFDRNAFVTACGVAKYTCQRCYNVVHTDGSRQCVCQGASNVQN